MGKTKSVNRVAITGNRSCVGAVTEKRELDNFPFRAEFGGWILKSAVGKIVQGYVYICVEGRREIRAGSAAAGPTSTLHTQDAGRFPW
jgi:hypothetical protein